MFRTSYFQFVIPGCATWRRPGIHTHGALGPWAIRANYRNQRAVLIFPRMRQAARAAVVTDSGLATSSRPGTTGGYRLPYAPGRSRMRLATMPSITSEVPPSIELALVRSQARGRAPPLE